MPLDRHLKCERWVAERGVIIVTVTCKTCVEKLCTKSVRCI